VDKKLVRISRILVFGFLAFCLGSASLANPGSAPFDVEPDQKYSKEDEDVLAEKIGISSELAQWRAFKAQGPLKATITSVELQNTMNKKIASAYFDSSAFVADVMVEMSICREEQLKLESSQNKRVQATNILNFATRGTIGTVATAISINPMMLPTDGNILGTIANGSSTGLSLVALAELKSGHSRNVSQVSLLAPIFFDNASHDRITPKVWLYLNSYPIGGSARLTHRQQLIRSWTDSKLAPNSETPAGLKKLKELLGVERGHGLTIQDLKKRQKMLEGLRVTIFQMNKGLEQLTAAI
jgi:hypothetical protein